MAVYDDFSTEFIHPIQKAMAELLFYIYFKA